MKNQTLSLLPASAALLEQAEAALAALGLNLPALVALADAREVVEVWTADELSTVGHLSTLVTEVLECQYFADTAAVSSHLSVTEAE